MRKTLLLFLSLLALSLQARQIIDLNTGKAFADTVLFSPERDVEYVEDGIIVTYKISKAALDEDDLYVGAFNIHIPGFTACSSLRMPGVPMGGDFFIVPKDSEPSVNLISAKHKDLKYALAPARWPMSMSDTVPYSKDNVPAIQPYSGFWPQEVLEEQPSGMYRSQPIANAAVYPVSYNYDNRTVRVYTEIKYKISFANSKSMADLEFEPGSLLNPNYTLPKKALKKSGKRILENDLLQQPGSSIDANAGYLIISVPEFQNTLQEFVKWKKRLGYNVTELYDAAWTPDKIMSAVKQQYDYDKSLMYVLFVGNHSKVPAYTISYGNFPVLIGVTEIITDFPYSCLSGLNDTYADLYVGRWPIGTNDELVSLIDKSLWYEQSPPTDNEFYKKASHFSFFEDGGRYGEHDGMEDSRFVKTCEDIRTYLMKNFNKDVDRLYGYFTNGEFKYWPSSWNNFYALNDTFMNFELNHNFSQFNWDSTPTDLINAVNDGRLYVLYFGHGSNAAWGNQRDVIFDSSDILKLRNAGRFPVLFSMCCETGDHSNSLCFINDFLTRNNGGAIAAFAATNKSAYGYNENMAAALVNAIWSKPGLSLKGTKYIGGHSSINVLEPYTQLGSIFCCAINKMHILESEYKKQFRYHQNVFNCFGDPSMYFRTEQPEVLDDNITVTRINDGVNVRLSDGKKAFIAIYDPIDNKVKRSYGDEAGYFTRELGGAKYLDIVVYTENSVPYMDLGEKYYGVIEDDAPNTGTRFLGYQNMGGGVMIDYYMSSSSAKQGVEIWIQDIITGQIESTWPLSRDGVCDQKASIGMRCSTGVKIAYMMVGGVPQPETMKMYVSR